MSTKERDELIEKIVEYACSQMAGQRNLAMIKFADIKERLNRLVDEKETVNES